MAGENKVNIGSNKSQELTSSLLQIKRLREKLEAITDYSERKELINELFDKVKALEKEVESLSDKESTPVADKETVHSQKDFYEAELKKYVHAYENISRHMEELLEKEQQVFEKNLTEEEITALKEYFATQKLEDNKKSIQIKNTIEDIKKVISSRKEKREVTEENKVQEEVIPSVNEEVKPSLIDQIESLYAVHSTYSKENLKQRVLLVKEPELENITTRMDKVPQRIVGYAKSYNYTPDKMPSDLENVDINYNREEVFSGSYEHEDENMSEVQQKQKVFDMMKDAGIEVDQESGFEISYSGEDSNKTINFKVYRKIMPEEEKIEEQESIPVVDDNKELIEHIILYHDNNDTYIDEAIMKRFHFVPTSELTEIEESLCYRINEEDVQYIIKNQDNNYSPYVIDDRIVSLTKEEPVSTEEKQVEEEPDKTKDTVTIPLYYEIDEKGEKEIYADISILKRFGVFPNNGYKLMDQKPYYKIREADEKRIHNFAEKKEKILVEYIELPKELVEERKEEEKEEISYNSVIDKLTVNVPNKENYEAVNLTASKEFLEDLGKDNVLFNIIYSHSAERKASSNLIRHLTENFNNTSIMKEYENRIKSLTDAELKVLLQEYKDSQTVNQINPKIISYLKNSFSDDLGEYESSIQRDYASLFHIIGKVKALEESLVFSELEKESKDAFIKERKRLIDQASSLAKNMIETREKVNSFMEKSSYLDFSEMKETYPYIAMRYKEIDSKKKDDSNKIEKNLEKALKENNKEAVVAEFLNLESCYYNDKNINPSLTGSHSIGVKYYNMLANQFGYRNDEFIQKLFMMIAGFSSEIHDITKQRIQDINSNSLLQQSNIEMDHWDCDNSVFKEDSYKLDEVLMQYETNRIGQEEVTTYLEQYAEEAQRKLIGVVNEIINALKDLSEKYPDIDLVSIQEKLETIIVHPEFICTRNLENTDIMLGNLKNLPKEMLVSLTYASSVARYAIEVKNNMFNDNTERKENAR